MTPERWQQVERLYYEALELQVAHRPNFLDGACAGDAELRRQVEALLQASDHASDFLSAPALEVAARLRPAKPAGALMGRQIGYYRVQTLAGAGGMGEVYRAEDIRLERTVALKILPDRVAADPDRMQRFLREAKAASAFNHPNVAAIYDVGESDGVRFIAMEYVEGRTLTDRIAEGVLDSADAVEIASQLADALREAHGKRITHRDIKPANIMLTPRGQVKILDFGLAKVVAPEEFLTSKGEEGRTIPGIVMGSVQYMSPEQVLGRDVDPRSDIFSLGIVLYEMVTGRLPFAGASAGETMDRILHAEPEAVARFNAKTPLELERMVRKCLEKDRERRYQSALELLVDLRNFKRDSSAASPSQPPLRRPRSRNRTLGVLALAVLAVSIGLFFVWNPQPAAETTIDSIAVLPFTNESGDPSTEYLGDGISESLINSLSQIPNLRVTARTTTFTYKGKPIDVSQVAQDLNVRSVLTGRVTQLGDTLTIQVDLVDAADGTQIWGDRFTRKLANIFDVQGEIATQISQKLQLRLSGEQMQRLTKRYTENTEAYRLFLIGRDSGDKYTRDGIDTAIESFNRALQLDSRYALAYAGLAEAYLTASDWYIPSREAGAKAKEAALSAVALDDSLSEAHGALGFVAAQYDWDWANAEREFKRAIELNPGSARAHHNYGAYLVAFPERLDESIRELRQAVQLDPRSAAASINLGGALYYARRYDEAIEELKQALDLDPNSWIAHNILANVFEQKGLYPEAIAEYRKSNPADFPDAQAWIGHGLAVAGKIDEARVILEQLNRSNPNPTGPYGMAALYVALGDKDQAIAWLQRARDARFIIFPSISVEPMFDSLRSDPRFQDLLRSIGLPPS